MQAPKTLQLHCSTIHNANHCVQALQYDKALQALALKCTHNRGRSTGTRDDAHETGCPRASQKAALLQNNQEKRKKGKKKRRKKKRKKEDPYTRPQKHFFVFDVPHETKNRGGESNFSLNPQKKKRFKAFGKHTHRKNGTTTPFLFLPSRPRVRPRNWKKISRTLQKFPSKRTKKYAPNQNRQMLSRGQQRLEGRAAHTNVRKTRSAGRQQKKERSQERAKFDVSYESCWRGISSVRREGAKKQHQTQKKTNVTPATEAHNKQTNST